jgi:predicted Zn-dependent protease
VTLLPRLALLSLLAVLTTSCSSDGDLNVFSVRKDLELGRQARAEILGDPDQFPVLSKLDYPRAYAYIQAMADTIVARGGAEHADVFPYEVTLIDQDVRNAFATPGGFIYVYTGLIKTLESGDQLAGVLGHEIAHAAARHSTDRLTKQYGIATLLSLVAGSAEGGLAARVASSLLNLRFSRKDEAEADALSVSYLCKTRFAADGAAGFFRAIQEDGLRPPEFLSSHPSPANRIDRIQQWASEQGCNIEDQDLVAFRRFRQQF